MAALNPLTRELVFKIVFYGPGLGGKTTTLQTIHARTKPEHRGKLVSLATPTDRTLYFDFLPLRLAKVRGMSVRLQLFTVPGQVYFTATRKLVLTGADGIVFVADSQAARQDADQESLDDLNANLAEHGRSLSQTPHAFQWNKRDLEGAISAEELDRRFNLFAAPATGTVATTGEGVFESLEKITSLVLEAYKAELPRFGTGPGLLDAEDGGLEVAVRELAESPIPRRASSPLPAATRSPPPSAATAVTLSPKPSEGAPPPSHAPAPASDAPGAGYSFAQLWPEAERAAVRQVEKELARGAWSEAVQACDTVVARSLASAANLAGGAVESPRDPALVAQLLGLAGPDYLRFRRCVRLARGGGPIDSTDALAAYHFVLDVGRARRAVGAP